MASAKGLILVRRKTNISYNHRAKNKRKIVLSTKKAFTINNKSDTKTVSQRIIHTTAQNYRTRPYGNGSINYTNTVPDHNGTNNGNGNHKGDTK